MRAPMRARALHARTRALHARTLDADKLVRFDIDREIERKDSDIDSEIAENVHGSMCTRDLATWAGNGAGGKARGRLSWKGEGRG